MLKKYDKIKVGRYNVTLRYKVEITTLKDIKSQLQESCNYEIYSHIVKYRFTIIIKVTIARYKGPTTRKSRNKFTVEIVCYTEI